ncbi:amino acid transporter [Actinosynnema sp. NPDC020468]|uniref:nucleotidyltransferase domain-containing protein n=1 Tax=Actinosynnema sp. NPDC020468 TaxID=3154488 RepID=UPI0033E64C8F
MTTSIVAPHGRWEPLTPARIVSLLAAMPCSWWIAGGYAIELAVGHRVRRHGDIDVMVLRPDQHHLHEALAGWECWAADPPGVLRPWRPGEVLPASVHDIWCRPGPGRPWGVQVMLDETGGGQWVSRRDPGVRRAVATIGRTTPDGIPYLAPEIQLYYKARNTAPKDHTDFLAALPTLSTGQRTWLSHALSRTVGPHPWHDHLTP